MNKLFEGKKVLIMGLGLLGGGIGAAKFFVQHGALVTVTDLKIREELASSLDQLLNLPIRYVLGKHDVDDFLNADLVLRNPAVPAHSRFLTLARRHAVPVEMEESLFLKLLQRRDAIGITGTRGKTTTTFMCAAIFKAAGKHVVVGGNVRGISTLQLLTKVRPETVIILELSSWQLQGFHDNKLSPAFGVITNIFPDHLNRYSSVEEYINDKKAIFAYQAKDDHLFLNRGNEFTPLLLREARSKVHYFSSDDLQDDWKLTVKGKHNRENAAAAFSLSQIFGIDKKIAQEAVENFAGVEFRLEDIGTYGQVRYINDSTSTMPEATLAALGACEGPLILIAGGNDKGLAYGALGACVDEKAKGVVLLEGNGTDKLAGAIRRKEKILGRVTSMFEAVRLAKEHASSGDTILLSPGFTSFGAFRNEFDRGEQFTLAVTSLAHERA